MITGSELQVVVISDHSDAAQNPNRAVVAQALEAPIGAHAAQEVAAWEHPRHEGSGVVPPDRHPFRVEDRAEMEGFAEGSAVKNLGELEGASLVNV